MAITINDAMPMRKHMMGESEMREHMGKSKDKPKKNKKKPKKTKK